MALQPEAQKFHRLGASLQSCCQSYKFDKEKQGDLLHAVDNVPVYNLTPQEVPIVGAILHQIQSNYLSFQDR